MDNLIGKQIIGHRKIQGSIKVNRIIEGKCYGVSYVGRNVNGEWLPYIYVIAEKNIAPVIGDRFDRVAITTKSVKVLNPKETKEYLNKYSK